MTQHNSQQQDEDQFEIMLSMEDYKHLQMFQQMYQQIDKEYKQAKLKWQEEIKEMEKQANKIYQQQTDLSAQIQNTKNTVLQQYKKFLAVLQNMSNACGIPQQSIFKRSSQMKQFTQISAQTQSNPSLFLCMVERCLNNMTEFLLKTFTPIESLITGHRLTNQALNEQNARCDEELQKVKRTCQLLTLKLQAKQKQYEFLVKEMKAEKAQLIERNQTSINEIKSQLQKAKQENQELKQKLSSISSQMTEIQKHTQLSTQQNQQLYYQIKELQQENKQYQEHIKILKSKLNKYGEKCSIDSQKDPNQIRQEKSNQNTKIQSKQKIVQPTQPKRKDLKNNPQMLIKQALVNYSREVKKNLISIGSLSQDQIRQIGASYLKTLAKFIQELQQDFQ